MSVAQPDPVKTEAEVAKLRLEAAEIEARIARENEAARIANEKTRAEIAKLAAEAESERERARSARITADEAERTERQTLASNEYHHVYHFATTVAASSVALCMKQLNEWRRLDPGCDIEIVFTSPGGEVIQGLALFDHIRLLSREGHRMTTTALGWAASMAGILLQAGDVRVMAKESWLMIHEVSFGASGKIGEVEDEVAFVKRIQDRVLDIFASRSGGKCSKRYLDAHWRRKDWYLSSDEALELGLVDEIR